MLREQLEAERQAHAEARRIIAGLVERVPALEAPESPETPSDTPANAAAPTEEPETPARESPTQARPWWRRMVSG